MILTKGKKFFSIQLKLEFNIPGLGYWFQFFFIRPLEAGYEIDLAEAHSPLVASFTSDSETKLVSEEKLWDNVGAGHMYMTGQSVMRCFNKNGIHTL